MNWKVDDRAIVDCPKSRHHGKKTTIIGIGVAGYTVLDGLGDFIGAEVDLPNSSKGYKFCVFEYRNLKPIPDKYNGLEISSWSECPWQPEKVVESANGCV